MATATSRNTNPAQQPVDHLVQRSIADIPIEKIIYDIINAKDKTVNLLKCKIDYQAIQYTLENKISIIRVNIR